MLDRVVSKDKEKVQFYLGAETIKAIFDRAASFSPRKTQSKYISDLVDADVYREDLNLRSVIEYCFLALGIRITTEGIIDLLVKELFPYMARDVRDDSTEAEKERRDEFLSRRRPV